MDTKIHWDIADLIVKRLSESITGAEEKQLEDWLCVSEEHQKLYDQIITEKGFAPFQKYLSEHDYHPKYQEFCQHVKSAKRKWWIKYGGYAAAIAIPLILLSILYTNWKSEDLSFVPNGQIIPGQYQAILILPNGDSLTLDKNSQDIEILNPVASLIQDTLSYKPIGKDSIVEYHQISIPRGGEYTLILADGSRVWLNSESELHYPTIFRGSQRKVFLTGEAYFEVTRDSLHPFIVETNKQQLTVLGTSFAIRAYRDESRQLTTLETGKVSVISENQQVILSPGDQSILQNGNIIVEKVNTSLYTAWHKGTFIFIDQPLKEILNTLSRWYDIEIFFTASDLGNIRFTGELKRYQDIQDLLEKIEQLEKVRFNIKKHTVTVSRY